jgi:bacteriorhodopsin
MGLSPEGTAMPIEVLRNVTRSSFLLVFIAFAACALFLALERDRVPDRFRTTLRVSVVYLTIASINYFYMKDVYAAGVAAGTARFPTEYRYVDWVLTTPLMLLKFPLLLGVGRKGVSFMTRLVVLDLVMIVSGWIGDMSTGVGAHYGLFLVGCLAWLFILVSLFMALGTLPDRIGPATRAGVRAMGLFVLVGWAIYPLGYFSPILGVPDDVRELVYNIADLVNKVGLCLVVYVTAKRASAEDGQADVEAEPSDYGSLAPEAAE